MFEAEVRRGAMVLDCEIPGWEDKLDLWRLAMNDANWCVLGQLYDDFTDGLFRLHGTTFPKTILGFIIAIPILLFRHRPWRKWTVDHGFCIPRLEKSVPISPTDIRWVALRNAWICLIDQRNPERFRPKFFYETNVVCVSRATEY